MIDFSASWCGPCKFIEPAIHAMSEKFTDVDFVKIDVDELPVIFASLFFLIDFHFCFRELFWTFSFSVLDFFFFWGGNRMWRRSLMWRRCRRSCCVRKGRKSTRLWAQRRTSSKRRLRNIDRNLSSVIQFIQLFIFLFKRNKNN